MPGEGQLEDRRPHNAKWVRVLTENQLGQIQLQITFAVTQVHTFALKIDHLQGHKSKRSQIQYEDEKTFVLLAKTKNLSAVHSGEDWILLYKGSTCSVQVALLSHRKKNTTF